MSAIGITPQAAYLEFLKTPFWADLRYKTWLRDGFKCVRCRSAWRIQAHHKVYRQPWTATRIEDLETLCRKCHEKEHGIKSRFIPQQPRKRSRKGWKQRLKKIRQKARKAKEKRREKLSDWKENRARMGWSF